MSIKTAVAQANRKMAYLLSVLIILLTIMPVPLLRAKPLATDVGGPIVSDTTWTLANSPYIVIANVEVWADVILTIEPGVVIKFNPGRFLQVNGTLVARGTATQPIVFTSNQTSPQPGNWGGIIFTDSSVDAVFDGVGNYLSGSVLQFCTVEYATRNGYSTYAAIDAQKAAPFVDHCTIQNNAATGIYITGSSSRQARVSNNTISNNSSGIFAGGIQARYSIINNNTISNNSATDDSGGGIAASNSAITNNVISNNFADPVHFGGGGIYATDESTISNNIITGNMSNGSGGGIFANGSNVIVIDNEISNNWALGSGGGITAWGTTVSDNIISFNSSTFGPGGGIDASGGTFSGNTVSHNGVYDSYGMGGGIYAYGDTVVINNIITSNSVGSNGEGAGVYLNALYSANLNNNAIVGNIGSSGVTLDMIFPISSIEFHQNNLYGNSSYDVIVRRQYDIDGTNNYWGTTESVDILAQVYDWYDDSNRGRLLYIPYLQDPSPDAPVPPPLNLTSVLNNDSVTLAWDAIPSSTTGYGYKVYYGTNSEPPYNGTGLNQGNSPIDVSDLTEFTLTGLTAGQIYYFAVTAYSTLGQESWYSNVANPFQSPEAPSNPKATPLDSSQIQLEWKDNSDNEAGFGIYDGATLVATVEVNTTSHVVEGLEPNSYHCYYIYAFNNYGNSDWSGWACATTLPAPTYTVSGQVTNQNGNPITGVTLNDGMGHTATTNTSGNYTIGGLVAGTYTITPTKNGYRFSPASLSVSAPPSKTGQNFTGKLCKSPYTGIDICQLQKGDMLLAFGQLGSIPQVARMIAGTYWFHVAVWVDDQTNFDGKLLVHATGPSTYVSNGDQVKTQSIYETYWWTGTGLYDWAVIRPLTTNAIKTQAATYASSKADQQNPDILYNISFLNKNREDRFYCSQLVWKAYQKQGLDLEADKGFVNAVVTPDDLYYSLYDQAILVQAKGTPLDRVVFRLHSPANMLLVNPLGKRVGFDPSTQQIVNEIPGTYYIGPNDEPEALSVGVPDISGWKLIVTGTGNGSYSLDAEVVDPSAPISQTVTLTTSPGQVDTFYIADPNTSGGQLIKKVQPVFLPLVVK